MYEWQDTKRVLKCLAALDRVQAGSENEIDLVSYAKNMRECARHTGLIILIANFYESRGRSLITVTAAADAICAEADNFTRLGLLGKSRGDAGRAKELCLYLHRALLAPQVERA